MNIDWPAPPSGIGRQVAWLRKLLRAVRQLEIRPGPDHRIRPDPTGGYSLENVDRSLLAAAASSGKYRGPYVAGQSYNKFDVVSTLQNATGAGEDTTDSDFDPGNANNDNHISFLYSLWLWPRGSDVTAPRPNGLPYASHISFVELPDPDFPGIGDGAGFITVSGNNAGDAWILISQVDIPRVLEPVETVKIQTDHGLRTFVIRFGRVIDII